ncbi:MAG: hypothetical protein ACRC1H_20735, partial [Caldilineaceae bacterium]
MDAEPGAGSTDAPSPTPDAPPLTAIARLEQESNLNRRPIWKLFAFPSLRARLVAIIFLALLPAFVLLLSISALERDRAEENAADDALATARILRNEYIQIIHNAEQLLSLTAGFPEIRSNDPAVCTARLQMVFATTENARGLSVADPSGIADCIAAPMPVTTTLEVSGRAYFDRAIAARGFAVGGLDTGSVSRRPNLTFGYAVTNPQGDVARVI